MRKIFLCIAILALSGCATLPEHYMSLEKNNPLTLEEILRQIENERVIFIGEAHTNDSDHLFQLEVIKYLRERNRKVIIALEVFPFEKQKILDAWVSGSIGYYDFEAECDKIWIDLYSYYGDIFGYARGNLIPLLGLSAGKAYINNIAKKGLGTVPEDKLKKLNFIPCSEDETYKKMMASIGGGGAHNENFPFFCDAQRLGDEVMAYNISRAVMADYTVVALLGAAHASKAAVPKMFSKYGSVSYKVLLPASFRVIAGGEIDKNIADYMWY